MNATPIPPTWARLLAAALTLAASWGCSSIKAPGPSPVPCSRVALDPAPPWTASAAWDPDEDEMLLVDPVRHSLVTYGRDGREVREVALDAVAELDYSVPMRLERRPGGYLLIDQDHVLHFDDHLALSRRERPFAGLEEAQGLEDGSLNDVLPVDGQVIGYADFIDTRMIPEDDPDASGTWRRGFVRLDPGRGKLELLHEFPIKGDGEFASYYFYGHRPYVAELGGEVYVLRFTAPWSVHRVTRKGLREVIAGTGEGEARSVYGWNGRLWVLSRRMVQDEGEVPPQPQAPIPEEVGQSQSLELLKAQAVLAQGRPVWSLDEIDPRKGRVMRRVELPTSAESLHLVPGRTFWTAVEEGAGVNLGREDDEGTSFLFLPATELLSGRFTCAPAEK